MVDLDYTIGGKKVGGDGVSGGGGTGTVADASTIQKGVVLLATQADAETGSNTTKALSPASGKLLVQSLLKDASPTQKGIVEISDSTENATGTSTTTAVSPAGAKEIVWQLSKRGMQPTSELFVDPVSGVDDLITTGAIDQPYKTLDYALKSANPELKTVINLSAGTYSAPLDTGFIINDFVHLTIKPRSGVATGQAKILVRMGTATPATCNGLLIRNCNEVFIKGIEFLCDAAVTATSYVSPINTAWESTNGFIDIGDCIFNAVPGNGSYPNPSINAFRSRIILSGTITIRGSAYYFLLAGLSAYCTNLANIVFENAPVFSGSFIRCEYNSLFRMGKPTTGAVTGRSYESRFNSRVELLNNFPVSMSAGLNESLMGVARATATLDFPAVAANASASLSMSVAGVAIGDPVALGTPVPPAGITFAATVTAANSVTITAFNRSASSVDVPAGSFTVVALKA